MMTVDGGGRSWGAAPIVVIGLLLAGCASHSTIGSGTAGGYPGDGHGSYRVGGPYQIKGIWYYPAVDYNYDKTGVASWYGEQFEGRYTANGEIFDMNRLTAANTTLPMPSIVQVTNLQNGRSLRLRVNDRGPFVDDRLIDVSRRAAQLLGFESRGTTPVEVKIIKDASIQVAEAAMHNSGGAVLAAQAPDAASLVTAAVEPSDAWRPAAPIAPQPPANAAPALPPSELAHRVVAGPVVGTPRPWSPPRQPAAKFVAGPTVATQLPPSPFRIAAVPVGSSAGRIFIQAGAFSERDNAQRVQSRIAPLGSVRVMTAAVNGIQVYRVRLGPVVSVEQADRLLQRVVSSGYPGARIVTD